MDRRRWTLLLIPPKNGSAREYSLPGWSFRAAAWVSAAAAILVVGAVTVLFSPWGTPGARIVAKQNASLQVEIAAIEARFRVLDDTLELIAKREGQLRLLAGLPVEATSVRDSARPEASVVTASLSDPSPLQPVRRRPFLGRLGWSARPDVDGLIARASTLARSFDLVSDTLQRNYDRFANTPSIMPTTGWLSSQFTSSRFHPILHENRPHEGIDVVAPTGTPIVAPATGTVVFAGLDKGFGLAVEIEHGNGIRTRFAHCSRIAVRTGQRVTRGQLIAAVGMTGLATAPHLHYEIHVNGKPVDPLTFVLPDA
ncbi:MAG: M23 family metallopeptidase [Gemmatimonadetes bacterium]|nr:M23 family metallopeptidase [Gemmatimonadota bacterium]